MTYPNPPGERIPWDRNGSVGFYWYSDDYLIRTLDTTNARYTNDESQSTFSVTIPGAFNTPQTTFGVMFAELWDLTGYYVQCYGGGNATVPTAMDVTSNSTNGLDGSWTTIQNPWVQDLTPTFAGYRGNIRTISEFGIKAVRFTCGNGSFFGSGEALFTLHFYGKQSAGANPDSLRAWDIGGGTELQYINFGDMTQGTNATLTFAIKNISAGETANGVSVTNEVLTDASPSLLGQFQFSLDNINFSNTVSLGNLGPGQTSAQIYYKNTVDLHAQLGPWALRIVGEAVAWA